MRNGPPLAVRMIFETSSMRLPARHWKIALCSLSTGRIVAPLVLRCLGHQRARGDQRLLVGERDGPARLDGGHDRRRPAQPTIAAMTRSASPAAASISASSPRRRGSRCRQAVPASRCRRVSSATTASLAFGSPGDLGKRCGVGRGGHGDDLEALGRALDEVERRFADRAGGAEDCDLRLTSGPLAARAR